MASKLNGKEQVLCIPRSAMNSILGPPSPGRAAQFLEEKDVDGDALNKALASAVFKARTAELERDREWLQLLPYGMVICANCCLLYERPNSGWGEARLRNRRSLGVGGHVNPCDVGQDQRVLDLFRCLFREIREELRPAHDAISGAKLVGLIFDESNEVGSVHLGLPCTVRLQHPTQLNPDPASVIPVGWYSRDKLATLGRMNAGRLENWSKVCRHWLVASSDSPLRKAAEKTVPEAVQA